MANWDFMTLASPVSCTRKDSWAESRFMSFTYRGFSNSASYPAKGLSFLLFLYINHRLLDENCFMKRILVVSVVYFYRLTRSRAYACPNAAQYKTVRLYHTMSCKYQESNLAAGFKWHLKLRVKDHNITSP